ncbi:MAG: response regulator [Bacteroidota bacterium]
MSQVLVIDDSTELLEMFEIVLIKNAFDVRTALNKNQALKKLATNVPDIILLDIFLRDDDGRTFCKELKSHELYHSIPIILMSSNANKLKDYQTFLADDYLEKPFSIRSLLEKMNNLLMAAHHVL